ncbi:hypothetical protein GCM10010116_05850 [Microbispora rosea subsp. aerata]|nr:hypothetical protein GCM10010116_05850 [Microbispora rosea subsp. aerata]GIH54514.1 hypothetical protein Mro02_14280 [Microbispora rosea subsp. aerata]GLJ82780.1 hypothetical protein GCM10017588_15060 [Microbispora rosea subsp. aerata]
MGFGVAVVMGVLLRKGSVGPGGPGVIGKSEPGDGSGAGGRPGRGLPGGRILAGAGQRFGIFVEELEQAEAAPV